MDRQTTACASRYRLSEGAIWLQRKASGTADVGRLK